MSTYYGVFVLFFKQKTAYEMRISDWSSDVCSSDLSCKSRRRRRASARQRLRHHHHPAHAEAVDQHPERRGEEALRERHVHRPAIEQRVEATLRIGIVGAHQRHLEALELRLAAAHAVRQPDLGAVDVQARSEEHTSELQSLMRTSYAVFCLKQTKIQ